MSGWFGKKGKQGHDPWQGGAAGRSPASDRAAKRATLFVLLSVLAAWMMSGLFVLKENQQATIFRLGKFHRMARVGLNWTLPYPIESHDITVLAESGSTVIGNAATVPQSGLRSEQLLTADGAIVEMHLLAQYRIRHVSQYILHQAADAEQQVQLAGAYAVRKVLAGMDLATLLDSDPQQIARRVQAQAQAALDAANSGIDITGLSAGADALRVPQAVQASYAQVKQVRAEKTAAAAQAASAASQMMAAATQEVTRLQDEARAYSKQVVAEAQAESAQFATVLPEYQRLPQAVRDRLYYDTMQQVYGQMNKVVVDSQSGQAIHIALERPAVAQAAAPAPGASASGATAAGSKAGAASAATSARTAASAGDAATNPLRSRDPDLLRQRRRD